MWMRGLTAGAFAAAMMVSGGAMATNITYCSSIDSISEWKNISSGGADSCVQGDKKWTLLSENLSDSLDIKFSESGLVHSLKLADGSDVISVDGSIKYKIEVIDALYEITGVKLTSIVDDGDDSKVWKKIYDGSLNEIDTLFVEGDGSDEVTGLHATVLIIEDIIDIRNYDNVKELSNIFTQGLKTTSVPEPVTLGLLGMGLVGLGAAARRRRAA